MSRPQAVPPEAVRSPDVPSPTPAPTAGAVRDPYAPVRAEDAPRHRSWSRWRPPNDIEDANRLRKQDLIFALLKNQAKKGDSIFGDGTLEVLPDGFGFLRSPDTSYLASTDDIYVSPVADPPLQPAHRRLDRGRDPHAEGRRALLRAGQGRQGQRRAARDRQEQDPVREPDAAASGQGVQARARDQGRGEHHRPRPRHRRADRQGPARPDRLAAQGRQDGDAAAHRARASSRTTPRSSLIVLLIDERPEEVTEMSRSVRGEVVASTFDEPAIAPRAGRRDGDREGQAPGRAQEGRGDPARLDHPPGARLQHRGAGLRQGADRRRRRQRAAEARSASSARRATSRKAARSPSSPPR